MVLSACNQGKKTLTSWSPFRGICNHLEGAPNCSAEAQCGIELGSVCACQNQHSATGTCSEPPCNNSPNGLYQALVWPCFPEPCGSCVALAGRGWPWVVLWCWWSWISVLGRTDLEIHWLGLGDTDIMESEMRELPVCICTCPLSRSHIFISGISGWVCVQPNWILLPLSSRGWWRYFAMALLLGKGFLVSFWICSLFTKLVKMGIRH